MIFVVAVDDSRVWFGTFALVVSLAGPSAVQPAADARPPRHEHAQCGDDGDGDERNEPHWLEPARPEWKDDREDDSAKRQPVKDAPRTEPVAHGPRGLFELDRARRAVAVTR